MYVRCIYGIVGREITKYTVKYGVYIYGSGQPYQCVLCTLMLYFSDLTSRAVGSLDILPQLRTCTAAQRHEPLTFAINHHSSVFRFVISCRRRNRAQQHVASKSLTFVISHITSVVSLCQFLPQVRTCTAARYLTNL